MFELSHLLDARKHDNFNANTSDLFLLSLHPPQSPLTVNSSAPVSSALSLLSAKNHFRFTGSSSSLVSSSGKGNYMDCPSRNQLSGVMEEPCGCEGSCLVQDYFQHFDQGMCTCEEVSYAPFDRPNDYDFTDRGLESAHSMKKYHWDNASSKGVSRISSRISTISSRWRPRGSSIGHDDSSSFAYNSRSRANSSSSALASSLANPTTRADVSISPPVGQVISEEPVIEMRAIPIDIVRPKAENDDELAPQATTPLLPPFMGDESISTESKIQSPLQSPSVASVTEEILGSSATEFRLHGMPTPPLSTKPSIASFGRPTPNAVRLVPGDASPLTFSCPKDEWANKLGHANFTIQPEPYMPEVCNLESFQHFRGQWDLARCNFARHLVRTGEHYGVTSNIYKLTEMKWESIDQKWKRYHWVLLAELGPSEFAYLGQTKFQLWPGEHLKIPRLHDNDKFPELGDQEIVGLMKTAPVPAANITGRCRSGSIKRDFMRFFHGLVSRS